MAKKKTSFASIMRQVSKQTKKAAFENSVQKAAKKKKESSNRNDVAQAAKAAAQAAQEAAKRAAAEKERKRQAAQKVAQASLKLTKMRNTQKKAAANQQKNKTWRDNLRADGKQAVAKAKKTDALGAKVKTKSYKTNTGMARGLAKAAGYSKAYGDAYKDLSNEKEYGKLTDSQKKQAIKEYVMPKAKAEVDKAVDKALPKTLKYRNLTSDEYLRLQNAERMPSVEAKNAALGKDLAKTVGSLNTAALKKGKFASGAMEGLNPLPVSLDRMGSGTYSNGEKVQNRKSKDSTAYKAGYMAGQVGSFFLGGGLGAGESGIAKGLLKNMGTKQASKALAKNGAKTGLKVAGKGTAKRLVRGQLDDASRAMISAAAKNASKTAGKSGTTATKRFVAGRVADAAVSSPLNASDAIKSATDENGNVHWGEAGKAFALNTGLDLLVGGGIDVGTKAVSKLTSKDLQKTVKILAKQKSGIELTPAETKFLQKAIAQAKNTVAERAGQRAVDELRAKQEEPFTTLPEVKSVAETESTSKIQTQEVKSGGVNVKSAEPIAKSEEAGYNSINGGVENGKEVRQVGKRTVSADGNGKANIRQVDEGVSGRGGLDNSRADESAGTEGLGNARVGNKPIKIEPETRIKMTNNGIVDTKLSSSDYAVFSKALDTGKSQNKFGAFVDSQSVDDLTKNNAKTFLSDDGSVGIAVKSDGDICGAFNSGKTYRGATKDLLVTARANGGTKMDCYGIKLVNKYEQAGFVPVAKVPFNAEYVDNALLLSKKPDVYVLMKNDDSIDEVIDKIGAKSYKESTQAELDALPTFSDYDEALAYRDNLLAEQESRVAEAKRTTKANDEAIVRHIDSMRKNGFTDDDILDQLQKMGTSPQKAMDMVENTPVKPVSFDDYSKSVLDELKGKDNVASVMEQAKRDKESIKTEVKSASTTLKRLLVDDFAQFENIAKEIGGKEGDDLIAQINAVRKTENKTGAWIETARTNFDGQIIGKSLKDIFEPFFKRGKALPVYEDFQHYVFNKHNIDRMREGKPVYGEDWTAEKSKQVVSELDKKYPWFKEKQQEVVDYFKDLRQMKVDSGILSKDKSDMLENMYKNYVSTYRQVNKSVLDKSRGDLKVNSGVRKAKGSDLDLLPLHEQMANATSQTLKSAEANRLLQITAKLQQIPVEKIDKDLDVDEVVEASTFLSHNEKNGQYKATFWENGEAVSINIDKDMYEGLKEWSGTERSDVLNWRATKVVKKSNQIFKHLITDWNPIFAIKNFSRDFQDAWFYTKDVKGFAKSLPKAVKAMTKKDDYYKLYLANGGKYSNLVDVTAKFKTDSWYDKANPLRRVEGFNNCVEMFPRMSEFISTLDRELKGAPVLSATKDQINKALYAADDITLNFGRSGKVSRALNSTIVPYFNPSVQGFDKLVRTLSGQRGFKGYMSLALKASGIFVAPTLLNEFLNRNVPGYEYLNERDKDSYYLIPMGDYQFIKIPKARTGSTLSSPFRHLLSMAEYGTPFDFEQLFKLSISNSGPSNPLENNLFSPFLNAATNKTWWGGEIENSQEQELSKNGHSDEVYDENTSAISKWLGKTSLAKKMGLSPKKINNILDGYTGVIGDFILPGTAPSSKGSVLKNNFVLDGIFSNSLAMNFWDKNAKLRANSKSSKATKADAEKYSKFGQDYSYSASTMLDAISDIQNSNMSKKEKNEKVRSLKRYLNQMYADGLKNKKGGTIDPIYAIAQVSGYDKAISKYTSDSTKDAYKKYKENTGYSGKNKKDKKADAYTFYRGYKSIKKTEHKIGTKGDYMAMSVSLAGVNSPESVFKAYDIKDEKIQIAKDYMKHGGSIASYVSLKTRFDKKMSKIKNGGQSTPVRAMVVASMPFVTSDRSYYVMMCDYKMNPARGLTKYGYSAQQISDYRKQIDADGNGSVKKSELTSFINGLGVSTEEKRLLFRMFGGRMRSPYGEPADYSIPGDAGIGGDTKKSSGKGRGGYGRSGRRRSGRSGSSSASTKKTNMPSWESYVKEALSNSGKVSAVNLKDWDSPIDSSFKSKTAKIRKKTTARM